MVSFEGEAVLTFSLFSAPDTVSFQLAFSKDAAGFECLAVQLSIVVRGMNNLVDGKDVVITQLDSSPATLLYVQCVNNVLCANAVNNLFVLIRSGTIQLHYHVMFGVDQNGVIVRNPTPVFTFPLWAIGVIIGGVAAIGILILLLCILCSRSKGRRKRKPQKAPGYMPMQDDVETGLMTPKEGVASGGDAAAGGAGVAGADAGPKEDKELTFEVLFSIKKSDKPDGLIVGRKELVKVMQSDWDGRGEFVKATTSKGVVGIIPSTHLKQKK